MRVFDKVGALVWAIFGEEAFGLAFVLLAAGAGGSDESVVELVLFTAGYMRSWSMVSSDAMIAS